MPKSCKPRPTIYFAASSCSREGVSTGPQRPTPDPPPRYRPPEGRSCRSSSGHPGTVIGCVRVKRLGWLPIGSAGSEPDRIMGSAARVMSGAASDGAAHGHPSRSLGVELRCGGSGGPDRSGRTGDPAGQPRHGRRGCRLRTAPGSKLTAADNEMPVAFEVDGFDEDRRAGWSVVVRGKATSVEEPAQLARLEALGVSPWADLAERSHWVRIRPYLMTGREIIHPTR